MADEKLDKKELAARIGELMKQHAESGQPNDNSFEALGATIAQGIEMMAWGPRLGAGRWLLFLNALKTNDVTALEKADEDYDMRCRVFITRFSLDEMWDHTHGFDRPEFRQQLEDQGLPVTFTNLARAELARIAKEQESK
uniref:Uncharacterized protein n=1 Tax=Pseudomonas phage HRDY3 TaxID=3236930 RepID=A0AB39CE22_9VIRU